LILCLTRVLFLLAALDPEDERVMTYLDAVEESWDRGPDRPLYDREELYTATAGEAIRHHLGLPLSTYRFMPYASGSLLLSIAAAPLYSLFGPHYLAFKLIPLLTTLLGGLFWFAFTRAAFGLRAARLFALLYLFAPSVLVRTALIAKGDHAEAMTLLGAVLWAGAAAARGAGRRRDLLWALTGLTAGFCVFVTYSTVPVLAAAALAACLAARCRWSRDAAHLLLGLLLGLTPWLWNLKAVGGAALRVYGRPLIAGVAPSEALARLGLVLNRGFLAGYDLPGALRAIAGLLFGVVVILGFVVLLRNLRRPFVSLLLLGAGAHLAAFCAAAPDASSRYLVPGYPLLLLAAALGGLLPFGRRGRGRAAAKASSGGDAPPSRIRLAVVAAVALCGLLAQAAVALHSRFPALEAPLRGTDWPLLGEVQGQKLPAELIRPLPPSVRPYLFIGMGKRVFYLGDGERWARAAEEAGPQAARVWEGIGLSWAESGRFGDAGAFVATLPARERRALLRGLTRYGEVIFGPLLRFGGAAAVAAHLNSYTPSDQPPLRLALARTLGMLSLHATGLDRAQIRSAAALLHPAEVDYAAGFASFRTADRRRRDREWKARPGSWMASVLPEARNRAAPGFWEGQADAFTWELEARAGGWILGGRSGPEALARELERATEGLDAAAAEPFYRAGGRSAARVFRTPYVAADTPAEWSAESWPWRASIPSRFQEAFREGLDSDAGE